MGLSPVLLVKSNEDVSITVRARLYDDFVEHEIILNSIFIYYKSNNDPLALKFLELLESVIKRTINEVMPHKVLDLEYIVKSDMILEDASKIEVNIKNVVVDDVGFKLDVQPIILDNLNDKILSSSEFTFEKTFNKTIETPDIVLKKYKQMQN